jgi:8-oxo-dGTP pyrophosphatase MutT (NUDIX family)
LDFKVPESVLVVIYQKNRGFLLLRRKDNGLWQSVTGSRQREEDLAQTAARELEEETGLSGSFTFSHIFHKKDYRKSDGKLLEDKLFLVMHCRDASGEMLPVFEGGENHWMTQEELVSQDKIFESARDFVTYHDQGVPYHAQDYTYDDSEY